MSLRSLKISLGALALLVATAPAQNPGPATPGIKPAILDDSNGQVHRMVIVNGTQPTVHYVGVNLSSSDTAALRELERAEAELAALDRMQKLRSDLIENETTEMAQRQKMRSQLLRTAASMPTVTTTQTFSETNNTNPSNVLGAFLSPFTFAGYPSSFGSGFGAGFGNVGNVANVGVANNNNLGPAAAGANAANRAAAKGANALSPVTVFAPTVSASRLGGSSLGGPTTAGTGSTTGSPIGNGVSTLNALFPSATTALFPTTAGLVPTGTGFLPTAAGLFANNNNNGLFGNNGFQNGYSPNYPGYGNAINSGAYNGPTTSLQLTTQTSTNPQTLDLLARLSEDNSPLRTELLRGNTPGASSDSAEKAEGTYLAALNRVSQSDTLRVALGGKTAAKKGKIILAGIPDVDVGAPVKVTFKIAEKTETVEGQLLRDDAHFLVVRTAEGRLSIAKNQVLSLLVKE